MWYYDDGTDQVGPFEEWELVDHLASLTFSPDSMVRQAGSAEWVPIAKSPLAERLPAADLNPCNVPQFGEAPFTGTAFKPTWTYRSTRGLAEVLGLLLVLYIILDVASTYMLLSMKEMPHLPAKQFLAEVLIGLSDINVCVFFLIVILWCTWTNRSAENVRAFGATGLKFSPGWAVGWYFIPLANWIMPYLATSEIWRATLRPKRPGSIPDPALVTVWWILWLCRSLASFFAHNMDRPSEFIMLTISGVMSGVMALFMVRDLSRKQAVKAAELGLA